MVPPLAEQEERAANQTMGRMSKQPLPDATRLTHGWQLPFLASATFIQLAAQTLRVPPWPATAIHPYIALLHHKTGEPPLPQSHHSLNPTTPSTPPRPPRARSGILGSTPILNKISGSHTYSSGKSTRDKANCQLAEEARGLFLGAMPPDKFLDEFLLLSQDDPKCPDSRKAFSGVVREISGKEVVMYAPFVSMVLHLLLVCLANIW